MVERIAPLLKWPGGKRQELDEILAALPARPARLHEPFVGGGAVWLATPPEVPATVNDASRDLMAFYAAVAAPDLATMAALDGLARAWSAIAALGRGPADPADPRRPARTNAAAVAAVARWSAALRPTPASGDGHRSRPSVDEVAAVAAVVELALGEAGAGLVAPAARPRGDGPASPAVPRLLGGFLRERVEDKTRRAHALQARRRQPLSAADATANVVGAVHAALYTAMRSRFNALVAADAWPPERPALFWAMRELAFAAMFRTNADGAFNVPYGGVSYSRKDLAQKVAHLRSPAVTARLATTTRRCGDVADALVDVGARDAVFLDPPYDTDFATYDGRAFGWDDQVRLEQLARALPCRVVAVVKDTPRVRELWDAARWERQAWSRTYAWTIKSRNERSTRHLLVTSRWTLGSS